MYRIILVLSVFGATAQWATSAVAVCVSSFAFDQPNYTVGPDATVEVPVYWVQTVSGPDISVLDPSSGIGMFSQGVQVRWDDPVTPSDPATVLSVDDIAFNGDFNFSMSLQKSVTESSAMLSETTDFTSFVYGDEVNSGVWRQWIGTFSFTAGSVPGEVTHLRAKRYSNGTSDYIVNGLGIPYDSETEEATATITTVPEPNMPVLLVGLLAGLSAYVSRKSR